MIVRLLAIENFYGINNFGFDLYRRMQAARIDENWVNPAVMHFKKLIESYALSGYDKNSRILLDRNLYLLDGSHRMAMAMYYNIPKISAKVRNKTSNIFYGIEWFHINGFSDEECQKLMVRYKQQRQIYSMPFVCILWSPIQHLYQEITNHLKLFGDVEDVMDFDYSTYDYDFYTRSVYKVDDIERWKIEKKIEYMHKSAPEVNSIRVVLLNLDRYDFRLKSKNRKTLSSRCELIKKLIRDAYKDKVPEYHHDIIIHIGDNILQNRAIYSLFTMPQLDIVTIFNALKHCNYVVAKLDVPYAPKDFPKHYPLGKDVDIICNDIKEFDKIVDSVHKGIYGYKTSYNIRNIKMNEANGVLRTQIRIEIEPSILVFLFDILCYSPSSVDYDFVEGMINNREITHGVYIPSVEYEIIIRFKEYKKNKSKEYHLGYIRDHKESINEDLLNRFLNFNWKLVLTTDLRNT